MIHFLEYDFRNKRALVRVDFNVPINKENFQVQDDKRIRAALPTINHILSSGGSVVLMSHFGRPKEGPEDRFSLRHILSDVSAVLGRPITFCSDIQEAIVHSKNMKSGDVMMLENVRFDAGETSGDMAFANSLAQLGDCYVNDAFGAAHRAHASTTQIASFFPNNRMMGLLMSSELENAHKILSIPKRPFTAIVGGAKISDKVLIIQNLLKIATDIIIGGGMAYTFVKAQGGNIGKSLVEEDRLDIAREILNSAQNANVRIHLPMDSISANEFSATATVCIVKTHEIPSDLMGLDIGPEAILEFKKVISNSKTILWNGPMGVFEWRAFENGTKEIAMAVAEATSQGAYSLIGGGDSASAIAKFNLEDKVSYVSTGGGALLELFEGKQLPGVLALS